MAPLEGLSDAHAVLLATRLCAEGDVAALPVLRAHYPHCFPLERLLRIILTFLPESAEPASYTPVLQSLTGDLSTANLDHEIDVSAVKGLSETDARNSVRKLRLLPLKREDEEEEVGLLDPLVQFLIHRAHRIDTETALQPLILALILPFYEHQPYIRTWLISSLLPALRLNYEYYPDREEMLSLDTLETMDDQTAVNILLSLASSHGSDTDLVNNLRGLVGPWLYGSQRARRQRLNKLAHQNSISYIQGASKPRDIGLAGWEYVNEWLLSRSLVDHAAVVSAFKNWNGPEDTDYGGYEDRSFHLPPEKTKDLLASYGQSGLSVVYAHGDSSKAALERSSQILTRVAQLLALGEYLYLDSSASSLPFVEFDAELISSTSRASLLQNVLLTPDNPLTKVTASSVSYLSALILSLRILTGLGHIISCRAAANICLYSSEEVQLAEFRSVITSIGNTSRSTQDWQAIRQQLLWLRDWQSGQSDSGWDEPSTHHGLFWRVSRDSVEIEILKALLGVREYQLAANLYTLSSSAPLNAAQVEAAVVEAIYTSYDNASNGNRTRGGMKRAYDILQAFQTLFPESVPLKQLNSLISATHALSFYSLILQHGVPFQPVSIRVHHDPLSLVEKVLEQNAKSYTKLDDLLSIGRNLVLAGLSTTAVAHEAGGQTRREQLSEADALVIAERRITSLAISSALDSSDFGTAYSYISTRLPPPSLLSTPSSPQTTPSIPDDISWRAVYNAGRYRSTTPNTSTTLQSQITHLSQRMELLSLALTLTPSPDPLPEILGAWRRCDEELASLRAREQQEEDSWDAKGDSLSTVPGGFGPTDSERDAFDTAQRRAARRARARAAIPHSHPHEAPMGLFEVARGAALALHKNAFPLRGAAAAAGPSDGDVARGERPLPPEQGGEGRVRKRDMVSNMVTGGLASGIGWVLGAEPVNR